MGARIALPLTSRFVYLIPTPLPKNVLYEPHRTFPVVEQSMVVFTYGFSLSTYIKRGYLGLHALQGGQMKIQGSELA